MRKVLAIVLVLFCLFLALPFVSANPYSPAQLQSELSPLYVALVLLAMSIFGSTIFLVRRKRVTKQSFLYLIVLSFWFSLLAVYTVALASYHFIVFAPQLIVLSMAAFGYMTMGITLLAIAYSGYLIRKKGNLVKKL